MTINFRQYAKSFWHSQENDLAYRGRQRAMSGRYILSKRGRPPTIAQVARKVGVSATTVSHALNGKGRVDEATRIRIVETARRMGYVPNRQAQSLVLGRSHAVGLIYPQMGSLSPQEVLSTDWYGRIMGCASQAAYDAGHALTLLSAAGAEQAVRLGLDGVIVLDPVYDDPIRQTLKKFGLPHVFVGRDSASPGPSSVCPDVAGGIRMILDHLIDAGATSIALLTPDIRWPHLDEERQVYLDWMRDHGLEPLVHVAPVAGLPTRDAVFDVARAEAREMLGQKSRPRAILGLLEDFGRAIIDAAESLQLRVPEDLMVAQEVDGLRAQLSRPPITALNLHPEKIVTAAMEMLLKCIQTRELRSEVITPVTLNVRASSLSSR
jgi:DNA-binding LacI/PurR family transcriptional regulator